MPDPKIDITGVGFTGKLILSDKGKTCVDSSGDYRKITWKVKDPSDTVKSIKLKAIHPTPYPFENRLPVKFDEKVKLTVIEGFYAVDWEYCIIWKDKDGIEHKEDPIISIRPSNISSHFLSSIVKVVLIVVGIITAALLFWKVKKE